MFSVSRAMTLALGTQTAFSPIATFSFDGSMPAGAALTRAGTGWYRNASGVLTSAPTDEARFNHRWNGAAWVPAGLLVEAEATNLLLRSQDISNAAWSKTNVTAGSAARMVESSGATLAHYISQTYAFVSGTTYCLSAEAAEVSGSAKRYLRMVVPSSAFGSNLVAKFDLALGTVTFASPGVTATIEAAGPGKWLCAMTMTASASSSTSAQIGMHSVGNTSALTYAGDGTSAIDVENLQMAVGNRPTSRIITAAAAVTRPADVLTLDWSSKGIPDGTISARYTFDDGSVQWASTTVASGHSIVPTNLGRSGIVRVEA